MPRPSAILAAPPTTTPIMGGDGKTMNHKWIQWLNRVKFTVEDVQGEQEASASNDLLSSSSTGDIRDAVEELQDDLSNIQIDITNLNETVTALQMVVAFLDQRQDYEDRFEEIEILTKAV